MTPFFRDRARAAGEAAPKPAARRQRWRRARRAALLLLALGAAHLIAWLLGITKLTTPGDVVLNLGAGPRAPELSAPRDGRRHVVVLLHGLLRSRWSMWKAERTLRAHGYEVFNPTYEDARWHLLELAARLEARIEQYLAETTPAAPPAAAGPAPPPVVLYGVGHSLGGLLLRAYARRPAARPLAAIVCLGSPHQGSALAAQLAGTWIFRAVLGSAAALDLPAGSDVVRALGPAPPNLGNVIGSTGTAEGRTPRVPGDDDGRVGVREAHLPGEAGSVELDVGHAFLPTDDEVLRQVLTFLRHRRFAPGRGR